MSADEEGYGFFDDARRNAVLHGIVSGFYHDVPDTKIVLDSHRLWSSKIAALRALYPDTKVVCCVRDVPWIFDSLERFVQKNPLVPSGLFGFDPAGTVYDRFESLIGAKGLVGFALAGLRQAFYGSFSDCIVLVSYESLTRDPKSVMGKIYEFLEIPSFSHDFNDVAFSAEELDTYLGSPSLHDVRAKVAVESRKTILPPDLYKRAGFESFWKDAALNPNNVTVL